MHSRTRITVRFAETDKMGIAHHSNYPVWYEIARNDFIKMFGTDYKKMEEKGVITPLLNLSCNYKLPAFYDDNLIIRTWVQTITAARIVFTFSVKRIENNGKETELGYGSTELGFVDSKTFRPCSLKKRMPKLFEDINNAVKHY